MLLRVQFLEFVKISSDLIVLNEFSENDLNAEIPVEKFN